MKVPQVMCGVEMLHLYVAHLKKNLSEYSFATLSPWDDQSVENLIEGEVDDVVQPEDGRRGQDGSVDDVDGEDKEGEAEE